MRKINFWQVCSNNIIVKNLLSNTIKNTNIIDFAF